MTTLLDFSHCNNTPDHADGAARGLQEAGIRAAFCYGFFESAPEATRFGDHAARVADFHRIADTHFSSGRGPRSNRWPGSSTSRSGAPARTGPS
ncbi:hypothetical protein [Pseudonocardia adelaidensis]|uniref:Uncharacterized protein n=1 Tax=Pseudonocardia adelaidensis TaxID=648754 RepID=A0ABP9NDG9_9PSEU